MEQANGQCRVEVDQDKGIVKVCGDLTSEQCGQEVFDAVSKLGEAGQSVVVLDLTETAIINSYGVGRVLACRNKLKESSSNLHVKTGGYAKELLDMLLLERALS